MEKKNQELEKQLRIITVVAAIIILIPIIALLYYFILIIKNQVEILIIHGVMITLSIISIICACYIMFKIVIPIKKAIKLLNDAQGAKLLDSKDINRKVVNSLQDLGTIGMLISKLASNINMEPQARRLSVEVALYALQSQINPHFLYNTLDAIRNYAMNYGVHEVADMAQSLASIFRYSISRPGEVASLADEISNVKAYLNIQRYRFSDRIHVVWDIDEENDDIMKYSLPVLTLQPLVENAIQHGLEEKLGTGRITISATTTLSKLIVSIEDNGCGISSDKLYRIRSGIKADMHNGESPNPYSRRKSGISLTNVNQRLKLYFGDKGGLSINSIEGYGTTVEVVVPKI